MHTDTVAALLRAGLLGLAALTTVGISAELASERHWTQPVQLVAWAAVILLALAIGLVAWAPNAFRVRLARVVASIVVLAAGLGIAVHVYTNHDAGPLDYRYSASWETLPALTQWWFATSRTVGPAPPFAPGALAQAALGVLLATVRHPALAPVKRQLWPTDT